MKKIVITGGLGYIGTELCKFYYGKDCDVTVIDTRFLSQRVNDLTKRGIKFVHGSIMDKDLVSKVLSDADIVYHLAGITDVAYTKFEENSLKEQQINEVGMQGSINVFDACPDTCKVIFPSTHVVYEGFNEAKFDIVENEKTCPVLSYARNKNNTEEDIKNYKFNYIITRLGSVYGYSLDSMRINIMPNLFSKITSQNGEIKLFSGGIQYKSLVNVIDVCRAMKFLAESDIKNETFHLTNENITVKDVADICKKVNPLVSITCTNDNIPNVGYTLSNQKLLNTGFKFLYNIESSIKEMVEKWSVDKESRFMEKIQTGQKEFVDSRGKISNYELTENINLIGLIDSKKHTIRANHYHPIQEQKCLLVKGSFISVTKDLKNPLLGYQLKIINTGDLSIIPPNVAHAMLFLEDSIFLNLVNGEREHENYGITHTIPYTVIDDKLKEELIKRYG